MIEKYISKVITVEITETCRCDVCGKIIYEDHSIVPREKTSLITHHIVVDVYNFCHQCGEEKKLLEL